MLSSIYQTPYDYDGLDTHQRFKVLIYWFRTTEKVHQNDLKLPAEWSWRHGLRRLIFLTVLIYTIYMYIACHYKVPPPFTIFGKVISHKSLSVRRWPLTVDCMTRQRFVIVWRAARWVCATRYSSVLIKRSMSCVRSWSLRLFQIFWWLKQKTSSNFPHQTASLLDCRRSENFLIEFGWFPNPPAAVEQNMPRSS